MRNPFRRRQPESRAITWLPWIAGGESSSTVAASRAMYLAPVWAVHRYLADGVATLPLKAYRRVGPEDREPLAGLPPLFQFMADEGTLPDWLTQAVMSLAGRGNAVGLITSRDGWQYPTAVTWLSMDSVHVDDSGPRPVWYVNGRTVDRDSLVHIPWLKMPGKTLGLSPIDHYAATTTAGLRAQEFGNDWFRAGGVPPGRFKNSERVINAQDAADVRRRLVTAMREHEPLVYGRDWDYEPFTITGETAQFVQTQKLTANQIAAIYGVAPEEIGGEAANSLTYSTEELRQIRRIADLRPWLVRLEAGLSRLLPERQYVRFSADATVRADVKSRFEVYEIARRIGLMSLDELRALEDRPPLPAGQGQEFLPAVQEPAEDAEPNVTPLDGSRRSWQIPA